MTVRTVVEHLADANFHHSHRIGLYPYYKVAFIGTMQVFIN